MVQVCVVGQEHDLSLKCCEGLNISIKTLNHPLVDTISIVLIEQIL